MTARVPARRWTGRHVLVALLLFFGVIAAVNGAMVWFALHSWPGRSESLHLSGDPRTEPGTWTG